jgi:GNAT superfamily N-acetyltransferase
MIELLEASASWLWGRGVRQWEPGSMRAQRSVLQGWADAGQLVVAAAEGELVGGCFLVDEPAPEWAGRKGRALYLHKLVVARSHAGRGVSCRLLDWCAERAGERGVPCLRLDCWDGNAALRAFYREAGYRELDAVPSYGYAVRLFELELEPAERQR